jgi:hypothetical protein
MQAEGLLHKAVEPQPKHLPHLFLEGAEAAGVEHEVGGGGGAHGAEALEEADDEEDQGLIFFANSKAADAGGRGALEGSVFEAAAEVERAVDGREGAAEVGCESARVPDRAGGEQAGENRPGTNGRAPGSSGDHRDGGAAEIANGGGFIGGVLKPLARKGGLDLEDRVDAFRGNVEAGGVREEKRRIKIVENGDIDLTGAAALRVDDKSGRGAVALGEIAVKQFEPVMFGGGSGGGGVLEKAADGELGEHLLLDAVKHLGEVDLAGIGWAGHGWVYFSRE